MSHDDNSIIAVYADADEDDDDEDDDHWGLAASA